MVLRLGLLMNAPSFSGSVVAREGDFYSFVESSIVHLPLIGLAGIRSLLGKKLCICSIPYKTSPQIEQYIAYRD
jgi:polysaccharide pyruvyl transferase WcaK-like protein